MHRKTTSFLSATLVFASALLILAWSLTGCNGSGGSGGISAGGSYGSVGVLLTDAPTDGFEHIYITITEVSLLPEGEVENPVVVFTSPEGYTVDLLDLRDEDFLLILNDEVPAGRYEKVRLRVSAIDAVGGPCDAMEIDLPSGKIDINPQGSFTVEQGQVLYLRLDIDAEKSINLHPAGKSGKCVFRPVVFAEVIPADLPETPCSLFVTGTIDSLQDADVDTHTDGLILEREYESLGDLAVRLSTDTVIFSEESEYVGPDDLETGQAVMVFGFPGDDGAIHAVFMVIGEALTLEGTVKALPGEGMFVLTPDTGEELTGDVTVSLSSQTLVMTPCGEELAMGDIDISDDAVVVGRYNTDNSLFDAVAVLLPPLAQ